MGQDYTYLYTGTDPTNASALLFQTTGRPSVPPTLRSSKGQGLTVVFDSSGAFGAAGGVSSSMGVAATWWLECDGLPSTLQLASLAVSGGTVVGNAAAKMGGGIYLSSAGQPAGYQAAAKLDAGTNLSANSALGGAHPPRAAAAFPGRRPARRTR